jgi:hypothetical protein
MSSSRRPSGADEMVRPNATRRSGFIALTCKNAGEPFDSPAFSRV